MANSKDKSGFLSLAQKTMAVISASITSLVGSQVQAAEMPAGIPNTDTNIEFAFKKELKPKLVLRLSTNPDKSLLVMHTSHRSHSSHSSHSSHYSSSSSSSYSSTVVETPVYRAAAPVYVAPKAVVTSSTSRTYKVTSHKSSTGFTYNTADTTRILYRGCEGADVAYMQQLLLDNGYVTPVNKYFGEATEAAVIKFQKVNDLTADGKVGPSTLSTMKLLKK